MASWGGEGARVRLWWRSPSWPRRPRHAAKAKPSPVRVQVLTQTQNAVAASKRIRVRVSSTRRGFVRLGGRVVTTPGGKRRIVRLTRRRTLQRPQGHQADAAC